MCKSLIISAPSCDISAVTYYKMNKTSIRIIWKTVPKLSWNDGSLEYIVKYENNSVSTTNSHIDVPIARNVEIICRNSKYFDAKKLHFNTNMKLKGKNSTNFVFFSAVIPIF